MQPKRFIYPSPGFDYYWKKGHGRKMLKKLDVIPNKEAIEQRLPLLFQYDKLADEVIQEVYLKLGFRAADNFLEEIFSKGIKQVEEAPTSLRKLFLEAETIPDWLDQKKLAIGAALCRRSGALGLIVLRNYCLMGGYESAAINKPLIFTQALKKGAAKRMAETIEFWVNVTAENALNCSEIGFQNCIKVRLMHAYARVSILKSPDWDNNLWGIPLNQWDMLATNLGFSVVFLDGLRNLGFKPSKQEVEGLLHFWKYIGYLLGIPTALLPDTELEAIEELYKWTITQPPADGDTQALAWALMTEVNASDFPKYQWQKRLLRNIHLGYNHFFLGARSCKAIGLPNSSFKYYPYLIGFLNAINELFVQAHRKYYLATARQGRKAQEKIKYLFLKGHESALQKK